VERRNLRSYDITGNYDRHGFSYVVPRNEVGAGTQVVKTG